MTLDNSTIRECERAHYLMQLSCYFSELTDLPGVRFAYTHRLSDIWYSQAYDIEWTSDSPDDIERLVKTIEDYLSRRDRLPCIYLSPATKPSNLASLLEDRNYGKFEAESWMFYDLAENNKPYTPPNDISIIQVSSDADWQLFSEVYRKGLPGPEVDKYIGAVIEGYKFAPPLVNLWYFVAKRQGQPAGMISLVTMGQYAGVYAVATVEEHRRNGVAKTLLRHVGKIAENAGCKYVFLQTVVEGDAEEVFKRSGYKTLFIRDGFTTKDVIKDLEHG